MSTKLYLVIVGTLIALIGIYWPTRHARHYDYIDLEDISSELLFTNNQINKPNLKYCDYKTLISNNSNTDLQSVTERKQFLKPLTGGEFSPETCNPLIKVAVIVPYRNRSQQLEVFLSYMHHFLQKQFVFYRIFIVNQNDNLPFNRAKMLNYGASLAIKMGFPCLVLHDVDLLPLNSGNIYGCSKKPRHMSSSVDTFRFNLPYLTLFGGAVAISSEQFQQINGLSNQFYGWGGEDDDFYNRLEIHNLLPSRFPPVLSKYTMLFHNKEKASPQRYKILKTSVASHRLDGLSNLSSNYTVKMTELYTLILAS